MTCTKDTSSKSTKKDCFKVDSPRNWYLPHHLVFQPHKLGNIPCVLNGAANFHGSSLNNALLTGLDLLQNLIHVLIWFRQYQYAVYAEAEVMFLKVGVIPQYQPSLQFLWREDPVEEIFVYKYVRHYFGAKNSPTSAKYALKANANGNKTTFPEAALSMKNFFSTDDHLESSPTV